jgi:5-methylcytosine-specific restriction endonuclease McrA
MTFCSRACGYAFKVRERSSKWKGGHPKRGYPIEFNDKLKARIKRRDGRKCVACRSTQRLEIHHRDKDRRNNADDNLVTLCSKCHRNLHAQRLCLI